MTNSSLPSIPQGQTPDPWQALIDEFLDKAASVRKAQTGDGFDVIREDRAQLWDHAALRVRETSTLLAAARQQQAAEKEELGIAFADRANLIRQVLSRDADIFHLQQDATARRAENARLTTETRLLADVRWSLDNILTIARREQHRAASQKPLRPEMWSHVVRLCERVGSVSKPVGILREGEAVTGSATEASGAAAAAGAESTAALTNSQSERSHE